MGLHFSQMHLAFLYYRCTVLRRSPHSTHITSDSITRTRYNWLFRFDKKKILFCFRSHQTRVFHCISTFKWTAIGMIDLIKYCVLLLFSKSLWGPSLQITFLQRYTGVPPNLAVYTQSTLQGLTQFHFKCSQRIVLLPSASVNNQSRIRVRLT